MDGGRPEHRAPTWLTRRSVLLEATDQYLAELVAEVGEPTEADRVWAREFVADLTAGSAVKAS